MKSFAEIAQWAMVHPILGAPDPLEGGCFRLRTPTGTMNVIASWAEGWDHVSVSRPNRCPTWDEMDFVKRCFFKPDETVMQLHVPEADHINHHPYCLHLWRPHGPDIPRPPSIMVGLPAEHGATS